MRTFVRATLLLAVCLLLGAFAHGKLPPSSFINVAGLAPGTVTANSLAPTCFSNPADTVFANTNWTPLSTQYLAAPTIAQFVIKSKQPCDTRDVEITTWVRQGYVYERLDTNGNAVYFFHSGDVTNGTLEIGIVTGLNEASYPSGTYYPLYRNTNLVSTVPGYSTSDTTGATFTFGVSGFDIYAKFNGVQFTTFKEYRQMSVGAVAVKANTSDGFRAITFTPLTNQFLYSAYAANHLDLRDWNVRSIQTTGSISATGTSLTVASAAGFQVGDWVIVEIGHEAGAGALGTMGVGGTWPAKNYATTAAMNADAGQATNTFAWPSDTGVVNQWNGASWGTSWGSNYYIQNAIPLALHGRITGIASNVLMLDTAATATATSANVYLDNQPYVNYLTANQKSSPGFYKDLTPITPTNETIIFPAGSYAGSGLIVLEAQAGWTLTGQGQTATTLFSPKGAYPIGFDARSYVEANAGYTFSNFTLSGNWGLSGYMVAVPGWTYIPGGLTTSGLMPANADADFSSNYITQTAVPGGLMYPFGVHVNTSDNVTINDVTINDVSQKAIGVDTSVNVNANRAINNQNSVLQRYVQWQFQWANTTNGACTDCTVNSVGLIQGFESFGAIGHQFVRPVSVNAAFSENDSQGWVISNASVTIQSASALPPSWSNGNPIFNINTNFGSGNVASGGTISNPTINIQGYIDSSNDLPVGIIVNGLNPNVTISGGSYAAPNYSSPGIVPGPSGIQSAGTNTQVSSFTACGTLSTGAPTFLHANIGVNNGAVNNSKGIVIVTPAGSGNATAPTPCP